MPFVLDPKQLDAVKRLKNGSILCGGVGSGKSRTALYYYFTNICGGKIKTDGTDLIVPPTTPKNLVIITTARKRDTLEWEKELLPFLLSTNPDVSSFNISVKVDSWNNIHKYTNVFGAFFIFDEQRVVGYGSWTKAFLRITKHNEWILLSATPGDKWEDYIPVFIANGFYKNKTDFTRRHAVYARYSTYPKIERWLETRRLVNLKNSILVNIDYIKPTESHHNYLMASYDRSKYFEIFRNRWNIFENKPVESVSELCYCLRKVTNSDPSRIDIIKNIILTNPKIIIFYNFDFELDMLLELCKSINVVVGQWNGHIHQPIPKEASWVYLVQYTAGAEGWNCITTNVMVFFSQNYSYKQMVQAAGRIDRRNTPFSDLYYYHIYSNSKIDLAINRCLKMKKQFNESQFIHSV